MWVCVCDVCVMGGVNFGDPFFFFCFLICNFHIKVVYIYFFFTFFIINIPQVSPASASVFPFVCTYDA